MVVFDDMQLYLEQSMLLLSAHPSTTRLSTRYRLRKLPGDMIAPKGQSKSSNAEPAEIQASHGLLIVKTFDPVSGIVLKYQTKKSAEIGRLISGQKRIGRTMAGLAQEHMGSGSQTSVAKFQEVDRATSDDGRTHQAQPSNEQKPSQRRKRKGNK